jgi:hypothetical protein
MQMTGFSGKALTLAASLVTIATLTLPAQDESTRTKSGLVKIGDRILANPTFNGPMDTCTVTAIRASSRPGYDGDYIIHCDHDPWTSVPATGDHMKLIAQTPAAKTAAPQPAAAVNPPPAAAPVRAAAAGNAFGSRNPRSCSAVTGGTPSTAVAAQLVACAREGDSRQNAEYLVDNVRVTSMTPSRYDPHTQTGFTNMDTSVAPIAIRGSLQSWSCRPQDPPTVMAKYSNVGQNCSWQDEPVATGYCYKMRSGAWNCTMADVSSTNNQKKYNVPPPR